MNSFKVGDKVIYQKEKEKYAKRTYWGDYDNLEEGKEYEVIKIIDDDGIYYIRVKGYNSKKTYGINIEDFILASQQPPIFNIF